MSVRQQFLRTVCACDRCQRLCKTVPGVLAPGDVALIAGHLRTSEPELLESRLLASPGAVLADLVRRRTFRVPTIVPDRDSTGRCVFLDEQNRCTIHAVAPFGCAYFDEHMPVAESNQRSLAVHRAIMNDHVYVKAWYGLWGQGRRAPAPEKLRAQSVGLSTP